MKRSILSLSFSIILYSCFAQLKADLPVLSVVHGLSNEGIPVITMPSIDVEGLLQEDAINNQNDGKMRFAFPFKTEIDVLTEGEVRRVQDGTIYRLHIDCPGAKNINFLYNSFFIPVGGQLHIYNGSKTEVIGAFTSKNNTVNRKFATAVINDDRATLEYFEPADVSDQSQIVISQVAHGYRSFTLNKNNSRDPGDSGACQVDINCSPEGDNWQDEKKGVGRITLNGSDWCSGCIVRNTNDDCEPLFLTADHCLPSGADAVSSPDVSGFVFYFNYEFPNCGSGTANLSESVSGGTILANDSPSDFALIELAENPLDAVPTIDVYFAGWDARDQTPVSGGVGIHHPSGDAKKIATHSQVPVSTGWNGSNDDSHWTVNWDATTNGHSVTEGGSSGSPIFDSNSRILGQLHGGSSINCSDPPNDPGVYGKVARSWLNNGVTDNRRKLQPWLDPGNSGINFMDGTYPIGCTLNKIQFVTSTSSVSEGSSCDSMEIMLEVSISAAPAANATVDVVVSGSALSGEDYVIMATSLTFNSGSSASQFIPINIIEDGRIESDEIITVTIQNLNTTDANVTIGATDSHDVTVSNDDIAPNPSSSGDFIVGSGALSTSGIYSPFRGYWEDSRFQIIYRASDLTAAGMQAGNINSLAMEVVTKASTQPYSGFTVRMKHTVSNSHPNNSFVGGFTQVFTGNVTTTVGWNTIVFDTPFTWDGSSNIMIETCFDNGSWTQNDIVKYDDVGYDVENMNRADDVTGCTMSGNFTYEFRPQMRFNIDAGSNIQTEVNSVSGFAELPVGPFETVHFYDANTEKIMATVQNLSAHNFGCTRVEVDREGTDDVAWFDTLSVSQKTFIISPENPNGSASVTVTLYYDSSELVSFLPQIGSMGRANVSIDDAGNSYANTNLESTSQLAFGPHYQYSSTFDSGLGGFGLVGGGGGCVDTLLVSGNVSGNQTFKASTSIRTNGLTVIQNGAAIFFDAGNFVDLQEEFEVELGAELTIRIQVCN